MGELRGFIEHDRKTEETIDPNERIKNYKEFAKPLSEKELNTQGARCMDCGIPFCHSGCPLGNLIPDFNDAVYQNEWKKAVQILHSTNNFPEFTGRLCPAPCESACVLGIIEPPVAIELIEKYIAEKGFEEGWIKPEPPQMETGKRVAVVGSGPAGLAAAQQLRRAGHTLTVFERDEKLGGLLRYGIPDFKMEKHVIDRRIEQMEAEGITFKTGIHVGKNYEAKQLEEFDAVVLCGGATQRRPLPIDGADAKGVVQAMEFLAHNNRVVDGLAKPKEELSAKDKHVIVIGGGDTGSDCVGTSNRHGAKSVTNFEIMPMPAENRTKEHPWPYWPFTLKTSSSHEEGVERNWSILTKAFIKDEEGNLKALKTVAVEWIKNENNRPQLKEIEGSEKEWPCDLALLALGFTGPEKTLAEQLGIKTNERTNFEAEKNYQTNRKKFFAAGDMRRGQSLIVWAISEGREAAYEVDKFLMGSSELPTKGPGDLPGV
ncbi:MULTISPECIES: glutamate synthase subunit beta [Mesonia]|mgnify:FL=1|uniref:Glutamate synthase [NADPH] small chain n=1 Tax=Mesonia oceanica TaxID=2687242 RepID=A0AC61Y5H7_9FLAO|nr:MULTISPECIES: glutamate synthase subunit beta [Mesonia]MAN28938.1 glutamate synthase [Mesonia sp.]MAQ42718.1 glutamate synthase [Mesonia sp.]MBJ99256.1 glutamate synthase [Flavobacteriaceae bacterium]VVU99745.1 Glutamate synthase [NADPH] small chain [Mesonia oceanica]|tara:strand:+ start:10778 stop:12238 length:1461 start_codon:yes stop_codon:yes gene_type:complete